MSLVAVPTYLWARRIASPPWAVAAAAIVLDGSGVPLRGLPDDGAADADDRHRRAARDGAGARAALDVALRRLPRLGDRRGSRPAAGARPAARLPPRSADRRGRGARPRAAAAARTARRASRSRVSVLAAAAVALTGGELSSRRLLGAYTPIGEETGVVSDRLGEIAWHLLDLAILGLGVAALATAALAAQRARGSRARPGAPRVRLGHARLPRVPRRPGRACSPPCSSATSRSATW